MKIYISGKITGLNQTDVEKKFETQEFFLQSKGYVVVNPLKICPFDKKKKWHDYMIKDIEELLRCDAIFMLKDWGQSKGARIEYEIAKELELKIFFESVFNE